MMRGLRWLPVGAAMAVVALVRAGRGSAGEAADRERHAAARRRASTRSPPRPRSTSCARGGNAFDAAIAAAGVLGVVEPYSCGIGGGGFMVIRDGETGKITTLDSREKSPAAMVPTRFFIDGKPPTDAQFPSTATAACAPACRARRAPWAYVLRQYGTYSLEPRRSRYGANVARKGFTVDQTFFDQTTPNAPYFDDVPSTAAIYLDADGTPKDVGTTVTQPRHGQDLRAASAATA